MELLDSFSIVNLIEGDSLLSEAKNYLNQYYQAIQQAHPQHILAKRVQNLQQMAINIFRKIPCIYNLTAVFHRF